MYSALKREGQPLYRLARAGLTVERAPRAHRDRRAAAAASWQADRLELRVLCSKGTYVRVLAEDIARALGTCGRLDSLRREYVEPFAGEPHGEPGGAGGRARPVGTGRCCPPTARSAHLPRAAAERGRRRCALAARPARSHGRRSRAARRCGGCTMRQGAFWAWATAMRAGTLRVRRLFSAPHCSRVTPCFRLRHGVCG